MVKNVTMLTNAPLKHITAMRMQRVQMPSNHLAVNVMMDMRVMVIFVMK